MTPSASKRCIRFQHGVDDRPTRLPISATEREAFCWSKPRILRSIASMEARRRHRRMDCSFLGNFLLYIEKNSMTRGICRELHRLGKLNLILHPGTDDVVGDRYLRWSGQVVWMTPQQHRS